MDVVVVVEVAVTLGLISDGFLSVVGFVSKGFDVGEWGVAG